MPSNRRDRITRRKQKNAIKEAVENKKYKKKISYVSISIVVLVVLAIGITAFQIISNKLKEKDEQAKLNEVYITANEKIISNNVKEEDLIRISAVGDIKFTNNIKISGKPYEGVFERVADIYKNRDVVIGNFNFEIDEEESKEFCQAVKKSGINCANIANKEVSEIQNYDYTLKYLSSLGLNVVGENKEDRIKIIENKGKKIALISYTADTTSSKVCFYSEKRAKEDLEKAKEISDYIIVMMDWKSGDTLNQEQSIAKYLVDNGADFIIGSNVEKVQRIETMKNKEEKDCVVAYSLGNYTDNGLDNNTELILNFDLYVDDNEVILYNVDFAPVYMRDQGSSNIQARYKIFDINKEIKEYEAGNNNIEEGFYLKLKEEIKELYKVLNK